MFVSDEDFEIGEVLGRTDNDEYLVTRIGGSLEDPERLKERDRILTAGRSRFARTFVHGIAIPEVKEIDVDGKNLEIETDNLRLSSRENDIGLVGPFSCITDPISFGDLNIDGEEVSLNYLIRDSRALLEDNYAGVRLGEGDEVARLGGFNLDDIAADYSFPISSTHGEKDDPLYKHRLEGFRKYFQDISNHPGPPKKAYNNSDYEEGQFFDPAREDPEFSEDGILPQVEEENPEMERTNSFVGDLLHIPLEDQAYQPVDARYSTVEDLEELDLEEIQSPVDAETEQRFDTVLAKTQEPVTYDGFYTVILKNQSGGEHVHSVVGDPFFEDPMILEYQHVNELPANARALLIEKD